MALFGKKKNPEQAAPLAEPQDEVQVVGGDADELGEQDNSGQVIDFDAIADELGDGKDATAFGGATAATSHESDAFDAPAATDEFASTADFNSDEALNFDSVFEGDAAATTPVAVPSAIDENPFGADLDDETDFSAAPAIGAIPIEPVSDAPPLTYTAPLLTSDAVATAGVPATRKSFPLPLALGALGLLLALGAVGYLVTRGTPEEAVVATNPPLRAKMDGASLINLGASVDGVPIAPGAVGVAPALVGPKPTVPLTPALLNQLKGLWKRGAAAKKSGDIAGARAAWNKMLQLRPNHPGVQSAIDQLPAA